MTSSSTQVVVTKLKILSFKRSRPFWVGFSYSTFVFLVDLRWHRFRRHPRRLDLPCLRRRQGTLREVLVILHRATMAVYASPNQHPRIKTSHFFCKDSHSGTLSVIRPISRTTNPRLPMLSLKQGILRITDKALEAGWQQDPRTTSSVVYLLRCGSSYWRHWLPKSEGRER